MSTQSSAIRHFRLALVWAILGAIGALALLPYALSLVPGNAPSPESLPVIAIATVLQMGLLLLLLNWLGLRLGFPLDLDTPLVRAWVYRQPLPRLAKPAIKWAIAIGGLGGILLIGLDVVLQPFLPPTATPAIPSIDLWKRLLASFYGGITEELLVRLFGMTLITWLGWKVFERSKPQPTSTVYWVAVVAAALLFGLGHLPTAATVWPLTPVVIFRVMLLNGLIGVPFGWLYWQWGLEYAMLAHFCADIVLQSLSSSFPST